MGSKTLTGLYRPKDSSIWHIDKQVKEYGRLCESTGTRDRKEAERYLIHRMEEMRKAAQFGTRPARIFRDAATKFLLEAKKTSLADDAMHLEQLDPFIGHVPLDAIHDGTLAPFIRARQAAGRKNKTINLALGVVRHVLNLAARRWRDERGMTWLETAPLITMCSLDDQRAPWPLTWDEQDRLFAELPEHLAKMALFKVNTGTREQKVCGLRWEWEVQLPEAFHSSIFLIPKHKVKNREERLVVLNRIAHEVVEARRAVHKKHVFTFRDQPISAMNNTAWQNARERAQLPQVRVHDLKHTFGRRLRAAGVSLETRKVLLGHTTGDITSHYSAPELRELIEAANSVCDARSRKSPELLVLRRYGG